MSLVEISLDARPTTKGVVAHAARRRTAMGRTGPSSVKTSEGPRR